MYLQITTKCNMKCGHCGYSCNKNGKHMGSYIFNKAIDFAASYEDLISIGGGEPTLHPDFFTILKKCLDKFEFVWFATNGSKTKIMHRLINILNDCDFESFDAEDMDSDIILAQNKLTVALSLDCFHDPINEHIRNYWIQMSKRLTYKFEVRNVAHNVIAQGRAIKTQSGFNHVDCICATNFIRPDGQIKLCGCAKSPIIGNVFSGINEKWVDVMCNNDAFRDTNCYKSLTKRIE